METGKLEFKGSYNWQVMGLEPGNTESSEFIVGPQGGPAG